MNDWLVDIETSDGVATTAAELDRFARGLDAQPGTAGAAASVDSSSGVVSATFTIEAADAVDAAGLGVAAFRHALAASGLAQTEPSRVSVERVETGDPVAV